MRIEREQIKQHNQGLEAKHQRAFQFLKEDIAGIEEVVSKL